MFCAHKLDFYYKDTQLKGNLSTLKFMSCNGTDFAEEAEPFRKIECSFTV